MTETSVAKKLHAISTSRASGVKTRFDINKHTLRVAGRKSRVKEGLIV